MTLPTPFYVKFDPEHPKRVVIAFTTREEASAFFAYMSKLAGDHADRKREQLENNGRPAVAGLLGQG